MIKRFVFCVYLEVKLSSKNIDMLDDSEEIIDVLEN